MRRIVLLLPFLFLSIGYSMEVQGHRGTRGLQPENTLPSFTAAIEAGADVLELDVQVSQDGIPVIHHDFFINPALCVCEKGNPILEPQLIRSLPLSAIKEFDCGNKFNPEFPKQQLIPKTSIPTLQELFTLIKESPHPNAQKVRLNLEIKRDPRHPEYTIAPAEFAKKLVLLVKENGFVDKVYYSSFDPEVLAEMRKLDPKVQLGCIFNAEILAEVRKIDPKGGMGFIVKIASFLRANILSPDHSLLKDKEHVLSLQKAGFRVIPWTVNEEERWEELVNMGVDGIITDYPLELIAFLEKKHLR